MANPRNAFLRLDRIFDAVKLDADLLLCLERTWPSHFNQRDYNGSWTAIALRSRTGGADDILAHGSERSYSDTQLLRECRYFCEAIDSLPFEKQAVRLMRLDPGSVINEHRDRGLSYRFGCFRLHVPIRTSADVEFRVDGEHIPMQAGECWYADFDLPHRVSNPTRHERVHLVIDGLRNSWTDSWFAAAAYDFDIEASQLRPELDDATRRRMIEELELQGTPAAIDLARQLRLGKGL